jgi:hypothetical protein
MPREKKMLNPELMRMLNDAYTGRVCRRVTAGRGWVHGHTVAVSLRGGGGCPEKQIMIFTWSYFFCCGHLEPVKTLAAWTLPENESALKQTTIIKI